MKVKSENARETIGTIVKVGWPVGDTPRLTVEYTVNGTSYRIAENVTVTIKAIKIGFLPIGMEKTWKIRNCKVGETVNIIYDCNNPKNAYIKGNEGNWC